MFPAFELRRLPRMQNIDWKYLQDNRLWDTKFSENAFLLQVTCINLEALSVDTDTRHTIKMNNNADCSPILLKMKNETYVFVCCCHYETWNTWDT